ncbi:MAG: hypothetical protein M3297_08810, partial [Thermoproteota archaeon]|nr:hypothetical protein [Thermoproteota archaeon]
AGIFIGRPSIERIISHAIETTSLQTAILWVIFSFATIVIVLFLLIRVDWGKIIGKRFPRTTGNALKDSGDNNKKAGKTG